MNSSKYKFSDHALLRAKERLNLNLDDFDIRIHCLKLIANSYERFDHNQDEYIKINDTEFYFIVNKKNSLIKTIGKIDINKQLKILSNNE